MLTSRIQVTGGNGSTGIACVIHALKAGYRVRTTVRRESTIAEIKSVPAVQGFLESLEVVLVSNITRDDAFLEALQGVTFVLHVASPMPNKVCT